MLDKAVVEKLKEIVGKKKVLTQKVDVMTYSYDATADMPRHVPDIVVMPSSMKRFGKL